MGTYSAEPLASDHCNNFYPGELLPPDLLDNDQFGSLRDHEKLMNLLGELYPQPWDPNQESDDFQLRLGNDWRINYTRENFNPGVYPHVVSISKLGSQWKLEIAGKRLSIDLGTTRDYRGNSQRKLPTYELHYDDNAKKNFFIKDGIPQKELQLILAELKALVKKKEKKKKRILGLCLAVAASVGLIINHTKNNDGRQEVEEETIEEVQSAN